MRERERERGMVPNDEGSVRLSVRGQTELAGISALTPSGSRRPEGNRLAGRTPNSSPLQTSTGHERIAQSDTLCPCVALGVSPAGTIR